MFQRFFKPYYRRPLFFPVKPIFPRGQKLIWLGAFGALAVSGGAIALQQITPAESSHTLQHRNPSPAPITETAPLPDSPTITSPLSADASGVHIRVNDEPLDVPANGSLHQNITNPDGSSTNIDVNNSQSDGNTHSHVTIQTHSSNNSVSSTSTSSIQISH